jgi:hypothetical protein
MNLLHLSIKGLRSFMYCELSSALVVLLFSSFYAHILNTEITTSIWFLRIFPRLFGLVQVPRTPQGPHLLGDFAVARP